MIRINELTTGKAQNNILNFPGKTISTSETKNICLYFLVLNTTQMVPGRFTKLLVFRGKNFEAIFSERQRG